MEMDDNQLKRLLQEGMEWDADRIMEEVNSDPSVKDAVAPEEIHDKLMKQIREHEDAKEKEREDQAKEDQELIRLGKIYKKNRARRKYIVLIAAVLCALGVGTISFGDGKKVFTEIQRMLGDREQTVVNTDDGEGSVVDEISSEAEAYEQIEERFDFHPVQMRYLPDGIDFVELVIEENLQFIQLYYSDGQERNISYRISTNYRTGSLNADIEDELIRQYDKELNDVTIKLKEYEVQENKVKRWMAQFTYEDAQYSLIIMGMEENEVDKIIENLFFF